MNAAVKEQLLARDYEGIPRDVCQAVYDTIVKEKYTVCMILTSDQNLLDWVVLAAPKTCVFALPKQKVDFGFTSMPVESLEGLSKPIRTGGQLSFYGQDPKPLRRFFNATVNYNHWMTIELPLGDGVFVAKRIG